MQKWKLNLICGIGAVIICCGLVCIKNHGGKNMGIDEKNMDLSVRPGDDFYSFVGAGWRKNNPLTGEYSRFGVFDKLAQDNIEKLHDLIKRSDNEKISTLYNQVMDTDKLNDEGIAPLMPYFAQIDSVQNRAEFIEILAQNHRHDDAFWGDSVEEDIMDSEHYLYAVGQGGIGMPEREYYFDTDEKSAIIREKYKKYMSDTFTMFGISGDVLAVYSLEESLARAHFPKEKLRAPEKNYHKMTFSNFQKKYSGIDWKKYFALRGVNPKNINVAQPDAFDAAIGIIKNTNLEILKAYIKWQIANSAMSMLGDAQYNLLFDFYGQTLSGKELRKPRWKDAVAVVQGTLGEVVGQAFVEKYFPAAAKERMLELVQNLRRAYGARIDNLDWMTDATKKRAHEKLDTFRVKIGYPDKWRDYSKLEISPAVSLYENMRSAAEFEDAFWLEKADGPVDKDYWYMNPQEVNAYYNPTTNEICFPAGILQPPFFNLDAPDAFNYGAIGSIIGHEMTHGFDDSGRKFDKDGNMKDWWQPSDANQFSKRADVMEKFFDSILVAPNLHANGKFTLGENLADYGGIIIAFDAYQRANSEIAPEPSAIKWTPNQTFFIAYGMVHNENIRPKELTKRIKTDPHSLSEWRVNGILPHIDAWYDAFGVTADDKMYIAPENRVRIW